MIQKSSMFGLIMVFVSLALVGTVSANIQTFSIDSGTVQIDIPYTVELGSSSGDSLQLIKPGTTKPIISINLFDSAYYKNLEEFAVSFVGEGHEFEKMKTDDGKPMLFNTIAEGTDRDGNPNYTYRGCIDYTAEKGKYVIIHAPNKVRYQGEVIATYSEDQFASICRSFTLS
jgi:hypothetical protein